MEENKNEKVYLIAGIVNATGKVFYWIDELFVYIGNYAIVENMDGYDLVKVIGRIETSKKDASKFSNTKYENMKKVIREIELKDLQQG